MEHNKLLQLLNGRRIYRAASTNATAHTIPALPANVIVYAGDTKIVATILSPCARETVRAGY